LGNVLLECPRDLNSITIEQSLQGCNQTLFYTTTQHTTTRLISMVSDIQEVVAHLLDIHVSGILCHAMLYLCHWTTDHAKIMVVLLGTEVTCET
jgi:hypothetical protein